MKIDLRDITLFGNDNAEDEDLSIFESYFYPKPETMFMLDERAPIAIVRAYKGEGKSAMLRRTILALKARAPHELILVEGMASDIAPVMDSKDPTEWFQAWKRAISGRIVSEIGKSIGFAAGDDASSLVEHAIDQGLAKRDFVSYLASRLRVKGQIISQSVPLNMNPEALLRRWQGKAIPVWIVLDDIDFNFEDKQRDRCRVGQFFSACRALSNSIPGLRFRLSVRPNIWTNVRLKFEDLNKLEQYSRQLAWSEDDIRGLLANRIRGYLERKGNQLLVDRSLPIDLQESQLVSMVFEDPMRWSGDLRPPQIPLATMSWGRPRWLVELCKAAGQIAGQSEHVRIGARDLNRVLGDLGGRRFADTAAEFRIRCPQVTDLMDAFACGPSLLSSDDLMAFATKELSPVAPTVDGERTRSPVDICIFLYEIGFLTARHNLPNGKYAHVRYADRPTLLSSKTNLDQGHEWEIHPVFRKYLRLVPSPRASELLDL